jgi:phosphatidylglycerophosphatase A
MEENIMATSKAINTLEPKNNDKRDYTNIAPIPDTVWQNPLHFVAFGFGTGTIPFAPGTFGTLIAIPFYLLMQPLSPLWYLTVTVLIILGSIWICSKATQDIGVEDHQGMCLDEVVGFIVTMFCVPHGWQWIFMGFILFRLFDIWKPWPIRLADKHVHGGFGIILDDVLAGVVSCIVLQILARAFL